MEHTLQFLPGLGTPPRTQFRVEVKKLRRKSLWKPAPGCSGLETGKTCNLTALMKNPWDRYEARVQAYSPTGGGTSEWQLLERYRRLLLLVRRTRDGAQFHMSIDYKEKTVIHYLEPGVEYCVTVSVASYITQKSVPANSCCAFTSPPRTNGSVRLILALLAVFCLVGLVLVGLLVYDSKLSSRPLPPTTLCWDSGAAGRRGAVTMETGCCCCRGCCT
ncbi:hypothetical protein CRUP_034165 [Coryphaenoides rupestris]|nr:hypothetical protein CRUP_034165 [Coryphaenoides rupestris]